MSSQMREVLSYISDTMEDETLEEALSRKYNIEEKLVAEGNFVALYGIDKEAVQLTAAGISSKSFIIATVALSGEEKDYDLISITPLPLIELDIQSFSEKKLLVKSQFKGTQLYQLCSCEDQDVVWMKFVRVIDRLQRKKNMCGDRWQVVPFESSMPLSGVDMQSADHAQRLRASSLADDYPWSRENDSSPGSSSLSRSASDVSVGGVARGIRISTSSSSLPETHTENFTLQTSICPRMVRNGQSLGSFESKLWRSKKRNRHNENYPTINEFKKVESIECLDVTDTTSSVFSECDSSIIFEWEQNFDQSHDEEEESVLDIMVSNSDSKCDAEAELVLNKSNNFLKSRSRFTELPNVEAVDDTNSRNTAGGFIRRFYRRWFCCKRK